ncbi:MAG: DEAD/DEAH box helicase family protein, partial [Myxococcota bacterium]
MSSKFQLVSSFEPKGDQPQAIDAIYRRLQERERFTTLLGITGSGKTFTVANVIAKADRPALIMAP